VINQRAGWRSASDHPKRAGIESAIRTHRPKGV
jgi:hypothetical protein